MSALPIVKDQYFKGYMNDANWKERQALAKWLLGDNPKKADVFVFGTIDYEVRHISATIKTFSILCLPYLSSG